MRPTLPPPTTVALAAYAGKSNTATVSHCSAIGDSATVFAAAAVTTPILSTANSATVVAATDGSATVLTTAGDHPVARATHARCELGLGASHDCQDFERW